MKYDPDKRHRRSIRVRGYDYRNAGAYYITLVTHDRQCLFGEIVDVEMRLNEYGQIAAACWEDIPHHFENVELDTFVMMPNHVHGIVVITDNVGATHASPLRKPQLPRGPVSRSLAAIIGSFKSATTKRINEMRGMQGATIWQHNYYEHIIRDENDLNRIREYIFNNPSRWAEDDENPSRRK